MNTIKYIAVHAFGGLAHDPKAKTAHLTEKHINEAHKQRWPDFPSKLNGSYIGYNVIIWPDGSFKQFRMVGEETAAQKGNNFDTISICLAGNFTQGVESPTIEQEKTLRRLCKNILNSGISLIDELVVHPSATIACSSSRIYPHRVLQPNHTECYGSALSDDWARLIVLAKETEDEKQKTIDELRAQITILQQIIQVLLKIKNLISGALTPKPELSGSEKDCHGCI